MPEAWESRPAKGSVVTFRSGGVTPAGGALWHRCPGMGIPVAPVGGTSVAPRAGIGGGAEIGHRGQLLLLQLVCTAICRGTYGEIKGPEEFP